MSETTSLVQIIEAALLAAGKPLSVPQLSALFEEHERPGNEDIREALVSVGERCDGRGYELLEVASGFRFQVREQLSPWIGRLWQERPQKYSRALLETLALVAYRQPITRGEIEEIRGVAVSTNIIRTLHERDWIRVVGHRDVPGRPAMYATTRDFLDYFNLKSLEQLPALADLRDLETLNAELGFSEPLPETLAAAAAAAAALDGESAKGFAAAESAEEASEWEESEGLDEAALGAAVDVDLAEDAGVEHNPELDSASEEEPALESDTAANEADPDATAIVEATDTAEPMSDEAGDAEQRAHVKS